MGFHGGINRRLQGATLLVLAAFLFAAFLDFNAYAAQENYDYDPLGRLVRRVDSQGQATDYSYDAAGNITQVGTGVAQAPSVSGISPAIVMRNRIVQASITGTGLSNVSVTAQDPGLAIGNVATTATTVTFRLAVSSSATLGAQTITLQNAAGSATATLTVLPAVIYRILPLPISLPPDNVARRYPPTSTANTAAPASASAPSAWAPPSITTGSPR